MKVGKVAACAVGGGIIILQIATDQGYIKINWDKVKDKAEKITDKVEEKITGEKADMMDKVRDIVAITVKDYVILEALANFYCLFEIVIELTI